LVDEAAYGYANGGHRDSLFRLMERRDIDRVKVLFHAASGGHMGLIREIMLLIGDNKFECYNSIIKGAVRGGHCNIINVYVRLYPTGKIPEMFSKEIDITTETDVFYYAQSFGLVSSGELVKSYAIAKPANGGNGDDRRTMGAISYALGRGF
jgi:hypothetical protein